MSNLASMTGTNILQVHCHLGKWLYNLDQCIIKSVFMDWNLAVRLFSLTAFSKITIS